MSQLEQEIIKKKQINKFLKLELNMAEDKQYGFEAIGIMPSTTKLQKVNY